MRIDWTVQRKREDLSIPEEYLLHDRETQNRRELTFLLQEAAFSEHIPIYCVIDLMRLTEEERELFSEIAESRLLNMQETNGIRCTADTIEENRIGARESLRAAILVGIPIEEPLLLMEQLIPETVGMRTETMAQLKVKNYLYSMEEKLDIEGYQSLLLQPGLTPDHTFSRMLECSKKGFAGKNGFFITEAYGANQCIGILLTDAPLMGGDYRYADYSGKACGDCRKCLDVCPCGALTENGYDRAVCEAYRNDPENQQEVAPYSRLKCNRCMQVCTGSTLA